MKKVLLTGASGFIGQALAEALKGTVDVHTIGRHQPPVDVPFVKGYFGAFEDLRAFDDIAFDAVIHLAAVTGGCLERDGIMVNVEGTRCLMRYLIDRGCRKFVMASSIAAVGFQNTRFRPLELPITETHPCLDRDGYGESKFLMEKITEYYRRQNEDIDVINLRLASIFDEENPRPKYKARPLHQWALGAVTQMSRRECVQLLTRALNAPHRPGVRIMNGVRPTAYVEDPVVEILRTWYPDLKLDLSYYEQPGKEKAALFEASRIQDELGFEPEE